MPGYYEFGEIEFTAAGTYVYKVTESGNVENVTNDPEAASGKTIEFTVTDNEGVLEVTPTTDEAVFTFTNTYSEPEPEPVEVTLEGIKNLEGRDLVDGEFSFELRDADGKVVTTATNDADGNIDFGTYTFDEEGTYTYTATEVQGSDEEITYDTSEQTFTIEVVANEKGGFDATVTCGDSYKAEFTNTYEKKSEEKETPKTGDSNPFGTVLVLAGAAALAIVSKKRLSLIGRD
jgi:pilin isopeptide linkage protein